jgi:hypothetical protein
MTDYKFIDISDDVVDMVVDAEFAAPLPPSKTQYLLHEISSALEIGRNKPILFEGLSAFQVTENRTQLHFRFSTNTEKLSALREEERDDLPKVRTHFVIYVFTKIDAIHRLSSVPFPEDFRRFSEFPVW